MHGIFPIVNTDNHVITTLEGHSIEFGEDDKLSFTNHVEPCQETQVAYWVLLTAQGFICLCQQRGLILCTFLSVLDYGDNIYVQASSSTLKALDCLSCILRFVTNQRCLTHRCKLYNAGWTSQATRRLKHGYILIYNAILVKLPFYLSSLLAWNENTYMYKLRS